MCGGLKLRAAVRLRLGAEVAGEGALPTESHESAWMAASLSAMYWPCAARFSAARFALFSLSSA